MEELLRTEDLGRIWTTATRREQLLDELERSGLSGKKFAALVGELAGWEGAGCSFSGDGREVY